jgi:exonuclease SbcC
MRFDQIHLENFKCYESVELSLDSGVTVIHGLNGSGKSSLLEACFFALYGSKALDSTLDEVVTIGAEETVVELRFTHAGESYHVRRRIRVSNGNARTAECVLESGTETIEGATDVRGRITELLRMDTAAFVNCAYVRQGEVNKLINASPSVRQDMLDDLLQLGKLEEYRERASQARVGIGRVRDDKQGALAEVTEQLDAKADKNLHERQNALETELSEVETEIERFEENKAEAEQSREEALAVIEEYEDKREELEELGADIEALRERIQEAERKREEFATEKQECEETLSSARERRGELLDAVDIDGDDSGLAARVSERIDTVQTEREEVTEQIRELSVRKNEHDNEATRLRERAQELTETATEKRETASELETEIAEAEATLDERREKVATMDDRIEKQRAQFEGEPVEFGEAVAHRDSVNEDLGDVRERRAELATELDHEREQLADAKALLEQGNCPECGQPVEGAPHVSDIDERRERIESLEAEYQELGERETELETAFENAKALVDAESTVEDLENERDNIKQLLDERAETIEEKQARIETLREEADDHEEEAATKKKEAGQATAKAQECKAEIAECNQQKAAYDEELETLEALADVLEEIATLEDEIDRLQTQRAEKETMNDERREQLAEKRERRAELEAAFDESQVEAAREQKQKAASYLEEVEPKLAELDERQTELQGTLGAVKNEIAAMGDLRERKEELAESVANLDGLYSEAEQLEEMYSTLRAELRQRNIESLERMLNETFDLVYENDTYARIEVDGEYRLTVYQKDGDELDPDQLSGGERALFNLSLRCAIYQLLAEGIEGTAPMPPLILDEPTVFLDSGHVSQLVELIEAMHDLGVEQILVVSHDEELVAAADDLVTVRKNPTTNRSSVERTETVDPEQLAAADD